MNCRITAYVLSVVVGASLLLAGCVTGPAPYGPKTADSTSGYTDQQLAQNRYRVTYTGTSSTPRATVENYLLFRAAEVTQAAGFPAFAFADRDTKAHTIYFTDDNGWFGFPHRRFGWYWSNWPMDDELESRPITRYDAYAEIVMLTADQAKADPQALNAADVLGRLGPVVMPPPPPPAAPAPAAHG
ncbi:MAG TPA: hypothetical protein VL971_04690 [Rhizomicrobium sp.]|nr:hypothetical protein [Rhizomicrobium sp.]